MDKTCSCEGWKKNYPKLNRTVVFANDCDEHKGWSYTGEPFICCPWCGLTLHAPDAAIRFEPEVLSHLEAALNILRAQPTPRR